MLAPGGVMMTDAGPVAVEPPGWFAPLAASRYLKGAIKPWEFLDSERGREWLENVLIAMEVESEVEKRRSKKTSGAGQTFVLNDN